MNQKGKILVVDDDRLVLATLTHGLSQAGFEVIDADNGDDAILLAREHRPELALLDIRMEGKSGFDVAAYLREYLQTPFMFLSAFADEGTIKQVKELGALTYLVKPLDIQQIVPAVEAAFANRPKAQAAAAAHAALAASASSTDSAVQASAANPAGATVATPASAPLSEASKAPAATPSAPAATAPATSADPLTATVAIAIGLVMHRHSLTRRQALDKLSLQARQENLSVAAVCERLINAQEVLAGLGSL
ncbi:response regulator [Aquabacterium sp.]|uniref:response regulator n=1 Tax=Aquabacterium sp. TaxID=1872578 RepID=UPI0025BE72B2|nr:response regulator [Aquabacterium sp.]